MGGDNAVLHTFRHDGPFKIQTTMAAFDLIDSIIRNPSALIDDEATWQITRVRLAMEQIPIGIKPVGMFLRKPARLTVRFVAVRLQGQICLHRQKARPDSGEPV